MFNVSKSATRLLKVRESLEQQQSTSTHSAIRSCFFLSVLPIEIRQIIYRLALTSDEPITIRYKRFPGVTGLILTNKAHTSGGPAVKAAALLYTCRRINLEATEVLYSSNTFHFEVMSPILFFNAIGRRNAFFITNLRLDFGTKSTRASVRCFEMFSLRTDMSSILDDCPNVRKLLLNFRRLSRGKVEYALEGAEHWREIRPKHAMIALFRCMFCLRQYYRLTSHLESGLSVAAWIGDGGLENRLISEQEIYSFQYSKTDPQWSPEHVCGSICDIIRNRKKALLQHGSIDTPISLDKGASKSKSSIDPDLQPEDLPAAEKQKPGLLCLPESVLYDIFFYLLNKDYDRHRESSEGSPSTRCSHDRAPFHRTRQLAISPPHSGHGKSVYISTWLHRSRSKPFHDYHARLDQHHNSSSEVRSPSFLGCTHIKARKVGETLRDLLAVMTTCQELRYQGRGFFEKNGERSFDDIVYTFDSPRSAIWFIQQAGNSTHFGAEAETGLALSEPRIPVRNISIELDRDGLESMNTRWMRRLRYVLEYFLGLKGLLTLEVIVNPDCIPFLHLLGPDLLSRIVENLTPTGAARAPARPPRAPSYHALPNNTPNPPDRIKIAFIMQEMKVLSLPFAMTQGYSTWDINWIVYESIKKPYAWDGIGWKPYDGTWEFEADDDQAIYILEDFIGDSEERDSEALER